MSHRALLLPNLGYSVCIESKKNKKSVSALRQNTLTLKMQSMETGLNILCFASAVFFFLSYFKDFLIF